MIHQLIFANPRPGMSPEAFQDYWISIHAKNFASKIPQIKKYKVSRIIPIDETTIYRGMAEIWLENETEQLASLQSPEFIDGARADEPNWAAFWESLCLDTTAVPIVEVEETGGIKLVFLSKRKGGIPLHVFRSYAKDTIAATLGNVKAATLCLVNDGYYAVGEAKFDIAFQIWFESFDALKEATAAPELAAFSKLLHSVSEQNGFFKFACVENIII